MARLSKADAIRIMKEVLAKSDPEDQSVKDTVFYGPRQVHDILRDKSKVNVERPEVRILKLGAIEAAIQLRAEGLENLGILNFASAKNPGGGFLNGQTRGQEENLCRCSKLYVCIADGWVYNLARKNNRMCLYSDFVGFSPGVEVVKDSTGKDIEPFRVNFLTSAAPNAGVAKKKGVQQRDIHRAMERRIDAVLAVAARHGVKNLVLGAWGTGCFGNSAEHVAKAFAWALEKFSFEKVIFAIPGGDAVEVFEGVFS